MAAGKPLTQKQIDALRRVRAAHGTLTVAELAAAQNVRPGTAGRRLSRLWYLGLVNSKRVSTSSMALGYFLTERGRRVVAAPERYRQGDA